MNRKQIITGIVGAMLVAGCTQSASYFPQLAGVFTAASALITSIVAVITSQDT